MKQDIKTYDTNNSNSNNSKCFTKKRNARTQNDVFYFRPTKEPTLEFIHKRPTVKQPRKKNALHNQKEKQPSSSHRYKVNYASNIVNATKVSYKFSDTDKKIQNEKTDALKINNGRKPAEGIQIIVPRNPCVTTNKVRLNTEKRRYTLLQRCMIRWLNKGIVQKDADTMTKPVTKQSSVQLHFSDSLDKKTRLSYVTLVNQGKVCEKEIQTAVCSDEKPPKNTMDTQETVPSKLISNEKYLEMEQLNPGLEEKIKVEKPRVHHTMSELVGNVRKYERRHDSATLFPRCYSIFKLLNNDLPKKDADIATGPSRHSLHKVLDKEVSTKIPQKNFIQSIYKRYSANKPINEDQDELERSTIYFQNAETQNSNHGDGPGQEMRLNKYESNINDSFVENRHHNRGITKEKCNIPCRCPEENVSFSQRKLSPRCQYKRINDNYTICLCDISAEQDEYESDIDDLNNTFSSEMRDSAYLNKQPNTSKLMSYLYKHLALLKLNKTKGNNLKNSFFKKVIVSRTTEEANLADRCLSHPYAKSSMKLKSDTYPTKRKVQISLDTKPMGIRINQDRQPSDIESAILSVPSQQSIRSNKKLQISLNSSSARRLFPSTSLYNPHSSNSSLKSIYPRNLYAPPKSISKTRPTVHSSTQCVTLDHATNKKVQVSFDPPSKSSSPKTVLCPKCSQTRSTNSATQSMLHKILTRNKKVQIIYDPIPSTPRPQSAASKTHSWSSVTGQKQTNNSSSPENVPKKPFSILKKRSHLCKNCSSATCGSASKSPSSCKKVQISPIPMTRYIEPITRPSILKKTNPFQTIASPPLEPAVRHFSCFKSLLKRTTPVACCPDSASKPCSSSQCGFIEKAFARMKPVQIIDEAIPSTKTVSTMKTSCILKSSKPPPALGTYTVAPTGSVENTFGPFGRRQKTDDVCDDSKRTDTCKSTGRPGICGNKPMHPAVTMAPTGSIRNTFAPFGRRQKTDEVCDDLNRTDTCRSTGRPGICGNKPVHPAVTTPATGDIVNVFQRLKGSKCNSSKLLSSTSTTTKRSLILKPEPECGTSLSAPTRVFANPFTHLSRNVKSDNSVRPDTSLSTKGCGIIKKKPVVYRNNRASPTFQTSNIFRRLKLFKSNNSNSTTHCLPACNTKTSASSSRMKKKNKLSVFTMNNISTEESSVVMNDEDSYSNCESDTNNISGRIQSENKTLNDSRLSCSSRQKNDTKYCQCCAKSSQADKTQVDVKSHKLKPLINNNINKTKPTSLCKLDKRKRTFVQFVLSILSKIKPNIGRFRVRAQHSSLSDATHEHKKKNVHKSRIHSILKRKKKGKKIRRKYKRHRQKPRKVVKHTKVKKKPKVKKLPRVKKNIKVKKTKVKKAPKVKKPKTKPLAIKKSCETKKLARKVKNRRNLNYMISRVQNLNALKHRKRKNIRNRQTVHKRKLRKVKNYRKKHQFGKKLRRVLVRDGNRYRNIFVKTLRHKPHSWIYCRWPSVYLPFLAFLDDIKKCGKGIMFVLAACFWTPCVISMELCRFLLCRFIWC